MTTQELVQRILALVKDSFERTEGRDESYRLSCYARALSDILKICRAQLQDEEAKR
jgi:hypothetical protein